MLQLVGLIVAVYTVVRLLQVPIEHSQAHAKTALLSILSGLGVLVIGFLTLGLLFSGADLSTLTK